MWHYLSFILLFLFPLCVSSGISLMHLDSSFYFLSLPRNPTCLAIGHSAFYYISRSNAPSHSVHTYHDVYMHECGGRRKTFGVTPQTLFTLFTDTSSVTGSWGLLGRLGCQAREWQGDLSVCASPALGLPVYTTMPGFILLF